MVCRDMVELIDPYMDGILAEESQTRVERHLLGCSQCAFEVRSLEQTRTHLREALPAVESSPAFRERMTARLADEFAEVLRSSEPVADSQWSLPFLRDQV